MYSIVKQSASQRGTPIQGPRVMGGNPFVLGESMLPVASDPLISPQATTRQQTLAETLAFTVTFDLLTIERVHLRGVADGNVVCWLFDVRKTSLCVRADSDLHQVLRFSIDILAHNFRLFPSSPSFVPDCTQHKPQGCIFFRSFTLRMVVLSAELLTLPC